MRSMPRALRWLLRLYPRDYRERYAQEMAAFHEQERRGGNAGLAFWGRVVIDHVGAAALVRWRMAAGGAWRLRDDLVASLRALRHAPSFTLFAVTTLALGIGATTAAFSVLDRVVLRPLPYPGSERMAQVGGRVRYDLETLGPLSPAVMVGLVDAPGPAEAIVGAAERGAILRGEAEPERVLVSQVSEGFFEMFGAEAELGRLLGDADHATGAAKAAVLGHGFWRDRYGADPAVLGRTLVLDDVTYTIVGVLDRDFLTPPDMGIADEIWVSLGLRDSEPATGTFSIAGLARLREGATLAELQAHADRIVTDIYPPGDGPNFILGGKVQDYRRAVVGSIGGTLGRVVAAVALLLLIACANVAGLLLTRGTQRAQELAVRSALGASRARLLRQLLSESLLIGLAGSLLGCALAYGSVRLFREHAPAGIPRLAEVGVDLRGLAFSIALGVLTVLIFGLVPALRSIGRRGRTGVDVQRRVTAGRGERRVRSGLVALETALAVVLAVGSALLARDLVSLSTRDPGFRPEGMASLRLDLRPRYERSEWASVWTRLLEGAQGLPGATSAAIASQAPYTGDRTAGMFRPEGTEAAEPGGVFVIVIPVGGDYVGTLGTSLVEGRPFDASDDGAAPVAIVSEAFVRAFWPGQSGVGKLVRSGAAGVEDEPTYQVVGVMADMVTRPGREPAPRIYLPYRQQPAWEMEIMVRTDREAAALAPELRALVRRIDPTLPVTSVRTVESLGSEALARPRFYTTLFGGFALIALLLAAVGVYATTSYATRARTREIGIRMALGARAGAIVLAVVARTVVTVGVGVALGLGGAGLASRLMGDVLSDVPPDDPLSYGAVAALVLIAGSAAAWAPAGRAGRIDPSRTLREEG